MQAIMNDASDAVSSMAAEKGIPLRQAAFAVALQRLGSAILAKQV
jgi:glutamate dehydrogenase/leucine dehydrogenase